MTTFALAFMFVSMTVVTTLAGWCLYKTMRHDRAMSVDDE